MREHSGEREEEREAGVSVAVESHPHQHQIRSDSNWMMARAVSTPAATNLQAPSRPSQQYQQEYHQSTINLHIY